MNGLRSALDNLGERRLRKVHDEGLSRSAPAEVTVDRVRSLAARAGITRVADVTGLDRLGIPVVMVVRPLARSLSVSQGKGPTLAAAMASGLMESLELHHAEHIEAPLVFGSWDDVSARKSVLDPALLPQPTTSVFHPALRILWIEGLDLLTGEPVWVPDELVDADYTLPRLTGTECFTSDSNGLASGNHVLEALVHGVCEVIERDAATLWRHRLAGFRDRRLIAPGSIGARLAVEMLDRLDAADIECNLWDVTTDVGVPVIRCELTDRSPSRPRQVPSHGYGCRPEPAGAAMRAIAEAVQSRLTFIAGSRDDLAPSEYAAMLEESETPVAAAAARPRRLSDAGGWIAETFEEDLERLMASLAAVGISQIAAVPLGNAAFGLPVVRVVVPGLEGLSRDGPQSNGLQPGRRVHAVMEAES